MFIFFYDDTGILNKTVLIFKGYVQLMEFSLMIRTTHEMRYPIIKGKLFFQGLTTNK